MRSKASTVQEYLTELPPERRKVISAVRKVIRDRLPPGYGESMNWGMISYEVPLARYPGTYNGQPLCYAALAAQKNYYTVYLMTLYGETEKRFRKGFEAAGKKLDLGRSCVRFQTLDDLPLDVIGDAVAETSMDDFIRFFEASRPPTRPSKVGRTKAALGRSDRAKARPKSGGATSGGEKSGRSKARRP